MESMHFSVARIGRRRCDPAQNSLRRDAPLITIWMAFEVSRRTFFAQCGCNVGMPILLSQCQGPRPWLSIRFDGIRASFEVQLHQFDCTPAAGGAERGGCV